MMNNVAKQKDLYQVSLKAILKNTNGEILILKADYWGTFSGFYDLPGGRIDEDEFSVLLPEILKREILEETGATEIIISEVPVAVGRHCIKNEHAGAEKEVHVFYVFFEVEMKNSAVKISDEHEGFEWVDLEKIALEKYFTSGILEGLKMYLLKNKLCKS